MFVGATRKNVVLQRRANAKKCFVSSIASLLGQIGFIVIYT